MHNHETDLKRIVSTAIQAEAWAESLYSRLHDAVEDAELKALLAGLASDEARHARILRERYGDPVTPSEGTGAYHQEGVDASLGQNPKLADLLEMAIHSEQRAHDSYASASSEAEDPHEKALFAELAAEEQRHHELLSNELKARKGQPWVEYELDNWVRDD